ncbi:pentatricopeptide repeat-containing protein [Pyrus ussuriensis x Pyrus communis]|uniref:Pentatricopeptide repeat-containing protein n=1 Tax=Pyrus ussuriensis x Pyrus communis TaxID=2448454 RepID=A0A5N5HSU8_9ROSA|nr:pentatricopeptide repeat-containing protein [Pyrus ussuriensis x Pyrus communis]
MPFLLLVTLSYVPSLILSCADHKALAYGEQLHAHIVRLRFERHPILVPKLVTFYSSFNLHADARSVVENSNILHPLPWNMRISSYIKNELLDEALSTYKQMVDKGIRPNCFTYLYVLKPCGEKLDISFGRRFMSPLMLVVCSGIYLYMIHWSPCMGNSGFSTGALELLYQMRIGGILLDLVTLTIGLSACSHIRAIKSGNEIHGFMIRICCEACNNFELIEDRSIITWNSMLSGYSRIDQVEETSFLFREMLYPRIKPNYLLPLCARVTNLQHGKEFHCYITKRVVFDDCLLLWNTLVDMYARSGKVLQTKRVFDSMSKRDEVTYTSIIAGYGVQGAGKVALKLFEKMNLLHIKSDHVTMVSILSTCSHFGIVIQGQMLGWSTKQSNAKEIISRMPYKPASAMWATLIDSFTKIVKALMRDLGVRKTVDGGDGFSPFLVRGHDKSTKR